MTALAVADIPRETPEDAGVVVLQIPVDQIDLLDNVRVNVEGIDELAASIAVHGVIQPVKVRPDRGRWALVWGQRRVLASIKAGRTTIPAIVVDEAKTGHELAIEQLVENLAREDLPPLDRARAMRLVVDAGMSQVDLARELGLHPSTVANDLRLLTLDSSVQALVSTGAISPSHAKAIASLPPKQQRELADRVVSSKWSSHDLEREIKWKQDAANNEAAKVARTERVIPKVIAMLEKAETPKGAVLFVHGPWDVDTDAVVKAVKAAGWKRAVSRYSYGGRPEGCDCEAASVEISGRNPSLRPTCANDKHQLDGRDADEKARKAAERERQRLGEELLTAVRADLGIARPRHTVVALISWALEWSHDEKWDVHVAHSDDELLDDIAKALTQSHRTRDLDLAAMVGSIRTTQGLAEADGPRDTTGALEVTAAAPAKARTINLKDPVLVGDRPLKVLAISYPQDATRQSTRVVLRPIDLGVDIEVAIDRFAWDRKAKAWRVDPETPA